MIIKGTDESISLSVQTCVYTPGLFCLPQPYPQLVSPTRVALVSWNLDSWRNATAGPPLSPWHVSAPPSRRPIRKIFIGNIFRAFFKVTCAEHSQTDLLRAVDLLLLAGAPLNHRHHGHVQLADEVGAALTLGGVVPVLAPPGHGQVDRWVQDEVFGRKTRRAHLVSELNASRAPINVDDSDVVVQVRTNSKLFVEVNLLNVKLLFFIVQNLNHIIANPDLVKFIVVQK